MLLPLGGVEHRRSGGRRCRYAHVVPLQAGCGLTIALTSRGDVLDPSVCVCPDNVPAVDDIATRIAVSVDILVAAARKSPRGHGRSVVTKMTSHATKRSHGRRY
jgi:hypothetical protein